MKQETDLSIFATLFPHMSSNNENAFIHGHHRVEYREIKFTILLLKGGRERIHTYKYKNCVSHGFPCDTL